MTALLVLFGALVLFTAVAAVTDWRMGVIPNGWVAAGLCVAVPLHALVLYLAVRDSAASVALEVIQAVGYSIGGVVVCAITPYLLFRFGAMGGGDVKLLAVIGGFVGPLVGMEIQVYAFLLILLWVAIRLAYQGQLLRMLASSVVLAANPLLPPSRRRAMPAELMSSMRFAPAVFVATFLLSAVRLVSAAAGI